MLDLATWMDDDVMKTITPKILRNAPNTYAYTKCLNEQLVSEYADKIPIAIVRPSIGECAIDCFISFNLPFENIQSYEI